MFRISPRFFVLISVGVLSLLFNARLNAQDGSSMRLDFGWTRNKNIYLWPIYKRTVDSCHREREVLFPVYKTKRDRCDGHCAARVLPILISDNTTERRDVRVGTLYYPNVLHYQRQHQIRGSSFRILELFPHFDFLEISKLNNGNLVYRNALYLFWYKRDDDHDRSHLILFPLLYNVRRGTHSFSLLFPLYCRVKNDDDRQTWIAPLLFLNKSSNALSGSFFPIVWWHKRKEENMFTVFPIVRFGKENYYGKSKKFWNAALIVGHRTETYRSFYNPQKRHYASDSIFEDSSGYETHTSQMNKGYFFPFWIQRHEIEKQNEIVSSESNSRVVFPFYWRYKSVARNNKYTVSGPGYDSTEKLVLFPVYWNFRTPYRSMKGVFPVYFRGENSRDSTAFRSVTPFLWLTSAHNQREQARGVTLFPIYFHKKAIYQPYGGREKDYKHHVLFPVVWYYNTQERNGDNSRSFVFFPLVWKFDEDRSGETSKRFSLFPVYWRENSARLNQVSVFPLFSHKYDREDHIRKLSITPFFRIIRGEHNKAISLFPLYFSSRNTHPTKSARYGHRVLFPLCWHYWDEGKFSPLDASETKSVFPLLWKRRTYSSVKTIVLPLYYKYETATDRSEKLCWLLYARQNRSQLSRTIALYGLYYNSRFSNNDKIFRIAYKLYSDIDRKGYREKSIFPFYHYTANKKESESIGYFLNFYNRSSKKLEGSEEYYREVRILWFIRILSNYRYLEKKGLMKGRRR